MPIDLPRATPAELGKIVSAPQEVVIVPDEAMTGTNVLRLGARAFGRFRFSFGVRSYAVHCAQARAMGFEAMTILVDGRVLLTSGFPGE